jgi:hypothetical protein
MYDNHNTFLESLHSRFMEEKKRERSVYNKDIHTYEREIYVDTYIEEGWKETERAQKKQCQREEIKRKIQGSLRSYVSGELEGLRMQRKLFL